jgi:transcriptional repressor NrdR
MKCPYCGYLESKVIDSRPSDSGDLIRRRRECLKCTQRTTTYEKIEEIPITVIKKNNQREPFDRGKIRDGLLRATVKRQVPTDTLEQVITDIETELRNQFKNEVNSRAIGDMVLERLRDIDKVAYVRFASVYREFQDVDEFTDELGRLQKAFSRVHSTS